ncbi:glycoside hydrolase 3 protein [Exophiala xenobiotica]|uniref:glucan 1,3-beta-glucosidase n=1 Tax=Lithohypha guttulata TaxID=1690604 RepID=A0ABR0JXR2_9EURO|nr:glycoside hydrolase 3 protein [Lithohypha guttulata]KAK5310550.1 glycoside hydrolase 3 protein [Exophiala xenobiotica]
MALGNVNPDGQCKSQVDFEADLTAIAHHTDARLVRTYSTCGNVSSILVAAHNTGFQVLLGLWPDQGGYDEEKTAVSQIQVSRYNDALYGITIGSEGLYRGTYSTVELQEWIADLQQTFPDVAIGTADVWNSWHNGSMDLIITGGVQLALINSFAYWDGVDISQSPMRLQVSVNDTVDHIRQVGNSSRPLHIMIGGKHSLYYPFSVAGPGIKADELRPTETGWPSDGGADWQHAQAGTANQETYWRTAVCPELARGVDVFWFEAFDERGKATERGNDARHWGAFTVDRWPKYHITC